MVIFLNKINNNKKFFFLFVILVSILLIGLFQINLLKQTGQAKKTIDSKNLENKVVKTEIPKANFKKINYEELQEVLGPNIVLINPENINNSYKNSYYQMDSEGKLIKKTIENSKKSYDGYIVKLKKQSILEKKKDLLNLKEKKESPDQRIEPKESSLDIETLKKLDDYKHELKKEEESIKNKIATILNKNQKDFISKEFSGNLISGFVVNLSESEIEKLKTITEIEISPNYIVQANLYDSVPLINADDVWQCNIHSINKPASYTPDYPCLTGEGVKIAIIDSGVDYTHSDLGGCFGEGCKVIGGYDFVNLDGDPMDDYGHGTHVTAIAAGNGVLKGVAPDAKILAYKVLDNSGSGYWDDVLFGIEQAILDDADIINLSLGGLGGNPDDFLSSAVDLAVDAGVVVVVAAGNNGQSQNTITTPGLARKAITVGAITKDKELTDFSSRGPVYWGDDKILIKPDIVAPGVEICAAQYGNWLGNSCLDEEHIKLNGTSMATPHVAGAAALLKQKDPNLTPLKIKSILKNNTSNLNINSPIYEQGYGTLDILKATNFEDIPIAKLKLEKYNLSDKTKIIGTATADDFEKYELYYSILRYNDAYWQFADWELICDGNKPVIDDVLCSFNPYDFSEGQIYFKLLTSNLKGVTSQDISLHKINNFEITNFGKNGYLNGEEEIKGYINFPNYTAYKIMYADLLDNSSGYLELCSHQGMMTDNTLCVYDFSNLSNSTYGFYLDVLIDDEWQGDELIYKVLNNDLLKNWPINTSNHCHAQYLNLISTNEGEKLIEIEPKWCRALSPSMGETSFLNKINVINSDGEIYSINELSSNSETYNDFTFGYYPYLSYANNNLIANLDYFSSPINLDYGGVLNFNGQFQDNWPIQDTYFAGGINPIIIDDKIFFIKHPLEFATLDSIFLFPDTYLFGFYLDGTPLPNFPIQLARDSNSEIFQNFYIPKINLIKSGGQNRIGLLYYIYDNQVQYPIERIRIKLKFNIYSETGELLSETVIAEDNVDDKQYMLSDFVSVDLDNDNNTEIIITFPYLDLSLDVNDPAAYKNKIFVLNSDGQIMQNYFVPNSEGYVIWQLLLANLDINSIIPNIILVMENKEPIFNEYSNEPKHKIKILNEQGNETSNILINDFVFHNVSVGDISGNGEKKLVVLTTNIYESSTIKFYNQYGTNTKNINIPYLDMSCSNLPDVTDILLGDLDNDGNTDITILKSCYPIKLYFDPNNIVNNYIFSFDLGVPYSEENIDWTRKYYDVKNTSCYKCD